jgi:hypothetical protein
LNADIGIDEWHHQRVVWYKLSAFLLDLCQRKGKGFF